MITYAVYGSVTSVWFWE